MVNPVSRLSRYLNLVSSVQKRFFREHSISYTKAPYPSEASIERVKKILKEGFRKTSEEIKKDPHKYIIEDDQFSLDRILRLNDLKDKKITPDTSQDNH